MILRILICRANSKGLDVIGSQAFNNDELSDNAISSAVFRSINDVDKSSSIHNFYLVDTESGLCVAVPSQNAKFYMIAMINQERTSDTFREILVFLRDFMRLVPILIYTSSTLAKVIDLTTKLNSATLIQNLLSVCCPFGRPLLSSPLILGQHFEYFTPPSLSKITSSPNIGVIIKETLSASITDREQHGSAPVYQSLIDVSITGRTLLFYKMQTGNTPTLVLDITQLNSDYELIADPGVDIERTNDNLYLRVPMPKLLINNDSSLRVCRLHRTCPPPIKASLQFVLSDEQPTQALLIIQLRPHRSDLVRSFSSEVGTSMTAVLRLPSFPIISSYSLNDGSELCGTVKIVKKDGRSDIFWRLPDAIPSSEVQLWCTVNFATAVSQATLESYLRTDECHVELNFAVPESEPFIIDCEIENSHHENVVSTHFHSQNGKYMVYNDWGVAPVIEEEIFETFDQS
ncbi:hypothetical protein PCE1_004055 [Barthelona sp. PCE]